MNLQLRTPQGKFIGRGEALRCWLPQMLDWCYFSGLNEMLSVGQRWCTGQAAEQLRLNASYLVANDADGKPFDLWGVRQAETWAKRRDVLIEAAKKLKEIG